MSGGGARIDTDRLLRRLADFAEIGGTAAGGVNRQAFSREDRRARALLAQLAGGRGFAVSQDPIANLFVTRSGHRLDAPPLLIGSHLDSQICGGRYDGALGVLAAFECLEALEDAGVETEIPVELAVWSNEEGSRFAPGVMGSSAFAAGAIAPEWEAARDGEGMAFESERLATLAALSSVPMRPLKTPLAGYLELHIEQGPTLEREATPIGVVTGIQGTLWFEAAFTGQTAHAGTTAAEFRRDALAAATTALHELYGSLMPADPDVRFTVGRLRIHPGAVNAIPQSAEFSIDLRHPKPKRLDAYEKQILLACETAARAAGCAFALRRTGDMPPVAFAPSMVAAIESAAELCNARSRRILSGAFHDALHLARLAPAGMIFVPCRDGLNHNEAEFVKPEHIQTCAQVLLTAALEWMRRQQADERLQQTSG